MPRLTFTLFTAIAAILWLRHSWTGDELPVLVALPLALWLGRPWRLLSNPEKHKTRSTVVLMLSAAVFISGTLLDLDSLQALSFTAALGWWLHQHLSRADWTRCRTLLPLALLAFPWISTDASSIGLAFRLSAAWVADSLFSVTGFHVLRTGTMLKIEGIPVSVEASCAGLHTLQAMLIAGVALAHLRGGSLRSYALSLLALPLIAWIANTLRILFLCVAALNAGNATLSPLTHDLGGWAVLMVAFLVAWHLVEELLPAPSATRLHRA